MNDIHKRFAKRSMKDAMYVYEDVVEDYEVAMPPEMAGQMIGQFALAMYQHRVQRHRQKEMEAKQESQYPDTDPRMGTQ